MLRPSSLLSAGLLLLRLQSTAGIVVELSEILRVGDDFARGTYQTSFAETIADDFGGVDPIDADCPAAGKCIGLLTRDGSFELDSRYGCTEPFLSTPDDSRDAMDTCGVSYELTASSADTSTIASVKIALHPDSISTLTVSVERQTVVEVWEAAPGSTELQEIPGLEGLEGSDFEINGVMEAGEYFAVLEVEIYVNVVEVPVVGTSASTRTPISATATTDASSVMNTLDGDTSDASSWTCSSGEVCEITYDLQAPESLEQLRIAFSEASDAGGQLNFMAAGESGVYSMVRSGIEAGGRPVGADGLQTFGGVRALARYVKIQAVPASGGSIVINEVEFRVGDVAPVRPVAEKKWLKPTGPLPLGYDPNYDIRMPSDGGCDSPAHFEGCHVYYMKDGDLDSRWSCGPLAIGESTFSLDCDNQISLNYYRYVRQIQIAFHLGDEQHVEFSIDAETAQGWMTVVASAISSGDTTDYQTFNVGVHAKTLEIIPKFQRVNQWFSVKEMVILEKSNNAFVAGTVPVFDVDQRFENDDDDVGSISEVPTRFRFDIPSANDVFRISPKNSMVTAVRMRFPADREFVFDVSYGVYLSEQGDEDVIERFTSAGGKNEWETFTFSEVGDGSFSIIAVSGPTFANKPGYPTLRVVDLQVVGELVGNGPGYFKMVTTAMAHWDLMPDIIGNGVSDQEDIMTAICETKGASFDGTDCVGELDDSTVHITFRTGDYFLDGPVFVKSGVTLQGATSDDYPAWTYFNLHEGANNDNTAEEAILVFDGVTDATVEKIAFGRIVEVAVDIVPGTLGNLCMDIRNSQNLEIDQISPQACRNGAARFTDSSNITSFAFRDSTFETGNYMELTRVDNFHLNAMTNMSGLLIDTCNNIVFEGSDESELPNPKISPPSGGSQTASVVITGDSSGIVFKDTDVGPGAEPLFLMESSGQLTLDNIWDYEEAESGDCIVGVPEGSADDLVVQLNVNEQSLSKSGDCWVLD